MNLQKRLMTSSLALALLAGGTAVSAQTTSPSISVPSSPVVVLVGNGTQQNVPVVSVPNQGQALIGLGALSGGPDHYGSMLSVSVLNTARLLGVDGPGGQGSALSISLPNPRQAPILSRGK
ncbi:hypothetical protein U1872_06895 [Sphingomonas sp. RB3P16]|uniref:hypothetical protein n=1 Tax=Parasphingomonas frigoris TaxID=3096163 RepID=UPI002FCB3BDD